VAANPLYIAHRQALADNRYLKAVYALYLGSLAHPRGAVLSAYRRARQRISSKADNRAVLDGLRYELIGITDTVIRAAVARGTESGQVQVQAYIDDGALFSNTYAVPIDAALITSAWMATYDAQYQSALVALNTGNIEAVIGDAGRLGLLSAAAMIAEGSRQITSGLNTGVISAIGDPQGDNWYRQAITTVDGNTTLCCLNVAGQIIPFEGQFHLTGTPRFADYMSHPPFHWGCRTVISLYRKGYEDKLTPGLEQQARQEKADRAKREAEKERKRNGKA
jgi:hypothetical protein